jgi:hypothetical protein
MCYAKVLCMVTSLFTQGLQAAGDVTTGDGLVEGCLILTYRARVGASCHVTRSKRLKLLKWKL